MSLSRTPAPIWRACFTRSWVKTSVTLQTRYARHASSMAESLPRVAQPSLWHSIVPKPLRRSHDGKSHSKPEKSKDWNPATFYIVMFLLIGSNAINMIALRNDFTNFSRHAEQQVSKLKRVIELVHKGEEVDVEKELGTGDPKREQEWEDILKEIESNDHEYVSKRDKRSQKTQEAKAKEAGETKQERNSQSELITKKPINFY